MKSLFFGLLVSWLVACSTTGAGSKPAPDSPEARALRSVGPEFLPAFESLQAAVEVHDDELARRILQRVMARRPEGRTLELALAFESVLEGRRLVDGLALRLFGRVVEIEGEAGARELVLELNERTGADLIFEPGPGTLRRILTAVDPNGRERRSVSSRTVAPLGRIAVPALGSVQVDLGRVQAELPAGALAARSRWVLELRSGGVRRESRSYPAMNLQVEGFEATRLASFLPDPWVEPEELVSYVERGRVSMPPLMERAVRIEPERREEALDAITITIAGMPTTEIERVVPALRWLARSRRLGGSALGWKRWLLARRDERSTPDKGLQLDLPSPSSRRASGDPRAEISRAGD